jgi:hypothetical protein
MDAPMLEGLFMTHVYLTAIAAGVTIGSALVLSIVAAMIAAKPASDSKKSDLTPTKGGIR